MSKIQLTRRRPDDLQPQRAPLVDRPAALSESAGRAAAVARRSVRMRPDRSRCATRARHSLHSANVCRDPNIRPSTIRNKPIGSRDGSLAGLDHARIRSPYFVHPQYKSRVVVTGDGMAATADRVAEWLWLRQRPASQPLTELPHDQLFDQLLSTFPANGVAYNWLDSDGQPEMLTRPEGILDPLADLSNRENHMAFGAGPHFCPGAAVSRLLARRTFLSIQPFLGQLSLDPNDPARAASTARLIRSGPPADPHRRDPAVTAAWPATATVPPSPTAPASDGANRFNRRTALTRGAAGLGALALAAAPQWVSADTRDSIPVDILIIGSGYAGSVAALRCAEAGLSTVVLERGRRWTLTAAQNTFATVDRIDGRAAWLSTTYPFGGAQITKYTGVLEAYLGRGVVCLAGAGVGGGSLVNNAVMMQPREDLFTASFGSVLYHDDMASTWYPRAKALLRPSPIPDDILADPAYANAAQFISEARRAGLSVRTPDMAIDWDIVRAEIAGRLRPAAILGASILGINSGAKLSVDRTVLAAAEATGLTTVLPLHQVIAVQPSGDRYHVTANEITTSGTVVTTKTFAARKVLFAAGSVATTRLLVSMRAQNKLPKLNDAVGRQWGSGGDHIVLRTGYPFPSRAQGGPANARHHRLGQHSQPDHPAQLPARTAGRRRADPRDAGRRQPTTDRHHHLHGRNRRTQLAGRRRAPATDHAGRPLHRRQTRRRRFRHKRQRRHLGPHLSFPGRRSPRQSHQREP